ncbi:MAG: Gfo/Idh/MocA family oxidoreductase [Gemmatimonadetes bacterium]|nr:Gfo/Idh/MocA family oxidoreductase [Gemmatimonadota bacterium]
MEKVPICLVGCGGMGQRHILGFRELEDSRIGNLDLVAVCDVRPENAALCAREAERLLGRKPAVFTDVGDALAHPDVAAVDVTTDPRTHHTIAVGALLAGRHALVEKPLGLTVRACRAVVDAAEKSGAVLATAENLRRDPVNRLARAVIDGGLLGDPYLMINKRLGGDDRMIITPWRHLKERSAIALDAGVHEADIIQYYMGEFDRMYGLGMIVEPVRRRGPDAGLDLESYRERFREFPETIEATGEDAIIAIYRMKSGAMVQFSFILAGRGSHSWERSVHGRFGALLSPGDRNGRPVVLRLEGRELRGREILPLLRGFEMSEITDRLFGKGGVEYDLDFLPADAKHTAIELHDFGEAILTGRQPEVGGRLGTTATAAILGVYESALAGRSVTMDEVLSGRVREYQRELDEGLGL